MVENLGPESYLIYDVIWQSIFFNLSVAWILSIYSFTHLLLLLYLLKTASSSSLSSKIE